MVLALFGVDGNNVDCSVFAPQLERLSRLGLDAECIRQRQAVFDRFDTCKLSDEQKAELSADELDDAGLDAETVECRDRALQAKDMADPAAASFASGVETEATSLPSYNDDDDGNAKTADVDGSLTEYEARCREALSLYLRGQTQKQIAVHFGKNERTVRNWLGEARKLQVAALKELSAESVLADDLQAYTTLIESLKMRQSEAWEKGDHRLALEIIRELRSWHAERRQLLSSIKFFDGYVHPDTRRNRSRFAAW